MSVLQEVLKANAGYASSFGVKGKLTLHQRVTLRF
jgi:hypothetical protein